MGQTQLSQGRLLNAFGNLNETGFAISLVKDYDRRDVRANKLKVKEWDSYYIGNQRYGLCLKIADYSYIGIANISFIDFEKGSYVMKITKRFMTNGKLHMPSSSKSGDVIFSGKNISLHFINSGRKRVIKCSLLHFDGVVDFECNIELFDECEESLVVAKPFKKKKHFVYNQKINCLRAKGEARIGGRRLFFSPQDSFAMLDWSRGVWAKKNTILSACFNCSLNGKKIGINFSTGINSGNIATENIIYYDNKTYRIDVINFNIPLNDKQKEEYMQEWSIKSEDGKVNLTFVPLINKKNNYETLIAGVKQNQIYGYFSGKINVNGKEIQIDNMIGFTEKNIVRF